MQDLFAAGGKHLALAFDGALVLAEEEADFEVLAFDDSLDAFRRGESLHLVRRNEVLATPEGLAVTLDDVIFERNEEAGGTGVALAACPAPELEVDAASFMAIGADDVESAQFGDTRTEADVGATSGHIGGDGDSTALSGMGNQGRFALFVASVEYVVGNVG